VVALVVGLLAAGVGTAAPPDDGRLTVTDVTVSPSAPTTADRVTFDVTLRASTGGPSPVALDRVELRTEDGETLATASDPGTLSQGDTLTVPLATTFDTAGAKDLVVVAVGTDDAEEQVRVRRPVPVVVERAPPQLEATVDGAVAGGTTTVTVAVSNPTPATLRNVEVTAGGEFDAVDGRATLADLAAGERATVNLTVRASEAGERTLALGVNYTTASGTAANATLTRAVDVAPAERDLGVRVGPAQGDDGDGQVPAGVEGVLGGRTTQSDDEEGASDRPDRVEVTVTNFGNAPATDVVLAPTAGDRELPRQAVADRLAPGESASVTVDLSSLSTDADVQFRVRGLVAGEDASAATNYSVRPRTGEVAVTGVNLSLTDDGTLRVSGNLGNVGEREVTGVVVRVGESEFAGPAYPQRSYFVGTVDGSEFAPFELTATVDAANVSTVPIEVQYAVAGEERTETVQVPFDDSLRGETGSGTSGALAGLLPGVAALAVLPVGWFAVRRFGRRP
jgi:hypothetical protein